MKKSLYLTIIVVFASALRINAQQWQALYTKALGEYEAQDVSAAYNTAQETLSTYLKEDGSPSTNYAAVLRLLENISFSSGDYARALEYVQKELSVRAPNKDVNYAGTLVQQGTIQQVLADHANATKSFQSAYDILKDFYGENDAPLIEARLGISINAYLQGDSDLAYPLLQEILSLNLEEITDQYVQGQYYFALMCSEKNEHEKAVSNFQSVAEVYALQNMQQSMEYASLMLNIGQSYHDLSQHAKAEDAYAKSAAIYESLNKKDQEYLTLVNARAVNYQALGQVDKAESLFSDIQSHGGGSTAEAIFLSNNAAVNTGKGDYKTAEQQYKDALAKLNVEKTEHLDLYGNILENLAILYDDMGRYAEAEKLLHEAENIFVDRPQINGVKIKLANVLLKQGQNDVAFKLYAEAVQNMNANGHATSPEYAQALTGMGLVWFKAGDIQKADSIYGVLLGEYESGGFAKNITYATVLNNYAAVKQTNGEFSTARYLLAEALTFARPRNKQPTIGYARALENLGYLDLQIGSLVSAKSEIDSAVLLYEQLVGNEAMPYALALITQGTYYQHAGEYALAEPAYRRAFKLISADNEATPGEWVRAANALAVYYQTMGNYDQAETLLKEIRLKSEKSLGKTSQEYSTALQNLASLYQLQNKAGDAAPMLEEALAIDKKNFGEYHPQYIIALRNLAALYQKTGKMPQAQVLLEQALAATRNTFGEEHVSYASTISNLAALYQDQKKMPEAEKAWQQTVDIRKRILGEHHPDYARALYGLASVYFAQGKFDDANAKFRSVIGEYLNQINEYFPFLSEKEKGAFYQKIKPVFDAYQDFCVQYYHQNQSDSSILKELYNTQLATKAILLNSSNKVRQTILSSGDTTLINQFKNWLAAKEKIVRYYGLSADEKKDYEPIDVLRQKANDIEKGLSLSSNLFRSQFSEQVFNTISISSLLKDGEAAAEIIRIEKKFAPDSIYYAALILKKDSDIPSLVIWPYGKKLESRFFKFHRNAIRFHYPDTISYKYYWKPFGKSLADVNKIYLSADGIFNKINFNILENHTTDHAVIEDYTIHLLSNTKEIVEQANRRSSPHKEINLYGFVDFHLKLAHVDHVIHNNTSLTRAFGFDGEIPLLPGTDKEVTFIHDLFKSNDYNVVAYKGADASESNIKKTPHVKVLHIATHGFFLNDIDVDETQGQDAEDFFANPLLRSGILLAGAGVNRADVDLSGEDGILTAYEAMNIDLNETDLVVLSACETALGEQRNGEGVYGLQRSFIVAGAGAVMMSLWQVDDVATQELMINFYQLWLAGETKHEAFRKAQMMIKEKYQSPFYWGAFILVGH
ncbi:MAG TPA: tetratricopeptide repeat protein [Chryseosolibacter sp.]|nr:tetratricopeptide repeat protein [Chryseosolibacter sp.]